MKKVNLTIAALAVLITMSTVNAAQTASNSTESYTYTKNSDGSVTTSKKIVFSKKMTDMDIFRLLETKIDNYDDLDNVSYAVHDSAVSLKGTVKYSSQKDFTEMMAKSIEGVTSVENLISVE